MNISHQIAEYENFLKTMCHIRGYCIKFDTSFQWTFQGFYRILIETNKYEYRWESNYELDRADGVKISLLQRATIEIIRDDFDTPLGMTTATRKESKKISTSETTIVQESTPPLQEFPSESPKITPPPQEPESVSREFPSESPNISRESMVITNPNSLRILNSKALLSNPFDSDNILLITENKTRVECSYKTGFIHVLSPVVDFVYGALDHNERVKNYWSKRIAANQKDFALFLVFSHKEIGQYLEFNDIKSVFVDAISDIPETFKELGVFDGIDVYIRGDKVLGWKRHE